MQPICFILSLSMSPAVDDGSTHLINSSLEIFHFPLIKNSPVTAIPIENCPLSPINNLSTPLPLYRTQYRSGVENMISLLCNCVKSKDFCVTQI